MATVTKDIVVESSKQWSEEDLAWRPPWPGAVFEPRVAKHLIHTLLGLRQRVRKRLTRRWNDWTVWLGRGESRRIS